MNRSKVQTALNKVSKALRELQDAVGDGSVLYLTNIGIYDKAGHPDDMSRTYGNVNKQTAINITRQQLDELRGKASRQQYEEVARELLADIPPEKLS